MPMYYFKAEVNGKEIVVEVERDDEIQALNRFYCMISSTMAEPPPPIGFEMLEGPNARTPPIGLESVSQPVDRPEVNFYPIVNDEPSDSPGTSGGQTKNRSLFFNRTGEDGKLLRVDYVLIYRLDNDDPKDEPRRLNYQSNMEAIGLLLEEEQADQNGDDKDQNEDGKSDGNLVVVKVHGPWDVLIKYAELMKMKMPLKDKHSMVSPEDLHDLKMEGFEVDAVSNDSCDCFRCMRWKNPFSFEEKYYKEDDNYYTCLFRHDKLDLFLIENQDTFFSNAERSRIVYEVMQRTKWEGADARGLGLRRLVGSGVYDAAYPLHEGPYKSEENIELFGADNDRHLLYELWASPKRWYKYQPLDLVRKYFGERIAIYFTWLGLYTSMLIPVSIIGILVFIYGLATFTSYVPAIDICNKSGAGNYTMCPLCDKVCTYDRLSGGCMYAKLSYLVDNPLTILFAIIMSLWGTIFLEMWKRREAELQYDWDVANFEEDEAVRPEYEAQCRYVRINPVTGTQEQYIPVFKQIPRYCVSIATVAFMVLMVLGFLLGVIIYRVSMLIVFYSVGGYFKDFAKIITSGTGACLNLIAILVLGKIYRMLAIFLTNLERPRTETDYDGSLTFKMYCFQFVNFYGSLFYIAFFKGNFTGRPGDYNYAMGFRPEECDPSGCLMELCIQMLIIFVGKQVLNNAMEILLPLIMNYIKRYQMRKTAEEKVLAENGTKEDAEKEEKRLEESRPQWERDFPLQEVTHLSLFDEYLEMVVQFGFVTLFVSAMPLAPFFALLNNIIEIRLDAYKMVTQWRRPYATRAQDIGVWYNILNCVAIISVLTNAFIIGYTSDTIPRLVYRYYYNTPSNSLDGFVDFYLTEFNTSDFQNRSIPDYVPPTFGNVEVCRYKAYREPYYKDDKYQYTTVYWHIFTARFIFILIFEHLILFSTNVIAWLVPDMPEKLKIQQKRERYIAQEIMFNAGDLTLQEVEDEIDQKEKDYSHF